MDILREVTIGVLIFIVTGVLSFLGLRLWNKLQIKKFHELCKEETEHVALLNTWLTELQTEGMKVIFESLEEVGVKVDDAKRPTLFVVLQNALFKQIDRIADEATPIQIEHKRKVRKLLGEDQRKK